MSVKKIDQVKKDKGFKFLDLIIYGVIAVMVVTAFLLVYFLSDRSELTGIRVMYRSEIIYEYDFEGGEIKTSEYVEYLERGEIIVIEITVDEGSNTLRIDANGRSARITEADCNSRSCVHMPEINDNSDTIICQTHYIVITPLIRVDDGNIII